jgi:translation initiation factor IF-1
MFAQTPESTISQTYSRGEARATGFLSKGELVVMVLVVLLLGYCWLSGVFSGGRADQAGPRDLQEVEYHIPRESRQRVRILVGAVQVLPTKGASEQGKSWDIWDGLPDLKVALINRNTDSAFYTGVAPNTLSADFNTPALWVREGDRIRVQVIDEDPRYSDIIGEKTVQITPEAIAEGSVRLLSFGQVESLLLQIQE